MSGESAPRLGLKAVHVSYGAQEVLSGLELALNAGEILCLLGPSGCGKTTTLLACAGLLRIDAGVIEIDGAPVSGARVHAPPEDRRVGFVFQDYALFPHLSVLGNVAFGVRGPRAGRKPRALAEITRLGLAAKADAYPHMLSGGEQQRVAFARALACDPRIVLMDEPFSSLDRALRDALRESTRDFLRARDVACLFVTHDPEEAMRMADSVALMRGGRIVQTGAPRELYEKPVDAEAMRFFGTVNTLNTRTHPSPFESLARDAVLMIRPEAIRPEAGGAGAITFDGEVVRACLLGSDSLILFRTDGIDETLAARPRGVVLPNAGTRMSFSVARDDVFVFPNL